MNKKLILLIGVLVVIAVGIAITNRGSEEAANAPEGDILGGATDILPDSDDSLDAIGGAVKEFSMTAFYEAKDGKPAPQFSLGDIAVKKGDRVRIKVTNTKGIHDFTINEYSIFEELPLDQEVTIEFTADKTGEFVYYCSKNGHRAAGQWGTLKVTE